MIRWDEIIETFIYGIIYTAILSLIGLAIFGLFQSPPIALCILGGIFTIYSIGWIFQHYNSVISEFKELNTPPQEQTQASTEIPIVEKLQRLEKKYHLSTVEFVVFVRDSYIPFGMDNLDYLEWVSLINELPSITTAMQGEDYNG